MGKRNRHTGRKIKLMDFITTVKSTKSSMSGYQGKIVGSIKIDSMKLKSMIGKKVRVIIKTQYIKSKIMMKVKNELKSKVNN